MNDRQHLRFDANDIDNALAQLSDFQLDKLAFGAILLDAQAMVLKYNRRESQITRRDPATVRGKHFFRDIAPCTRTPAFEGKFKELVEGGSEALFEYVFDHKMDPTKVRVHMKRALMGDAFWILVSRI